MITNFLAAGSLAALDGEVATSPSRGARFLLSRLHLMQSLVLGTVLTGVSMKWTFNSGQSKEGTNGDSD